MVCKRESVCERERDDGADVVAPLHLLHLRVHPGALQGLKRELLYRGGRSRNQAKSGELQTDCSEVAGRLASRGRADLGNETLDAARAQGRFLERPRQVARSFYSLLHKTKIDLGFEARQGGRGGERVRSRVAKRKCAYA